MSQKPRKIKAEPARATAVIPTMSRRQPTQDRAKARVERILVAATELIAETGSDAVRMTEVAARAGIPIGSLYQYFPDKTAILRLLIMRFMERTRDVLSATISGVTDRATAIERIDALVVGYYQSFLNEPVIRDVWSGAQSDKILQEIDVEDSRLNGKLMFDAFKSMVLKAKHERFGIVCFLLMQTAGTATRLAIAVDRKEGDMLVEEYRRIARTELEGFLRD